MLRILALYVIPARVLFFTRPGQAFLSLYYRYYCPHPISDYTSARDCVAGGHCGCNNQDRYRCQS